MDTERLPSTILLMLGLLTLAKAVWGAAKPLALKRTAAWWTRAALQVNTLVGCLLLLIAAGIWVVVHLNQPLVNWILMLFGVLFAWWGTVYFSPQILQRVLNATVADRSPSTIRTLAAITGLLAMGVILIAIRGL